VKRLIVTADDFGAGLSVNEAVETAHRQGILTATSLMVGAPAAEDAVRRARANPSLRVGLHLVLVEGEPVLPAHELPDLVSATGRFRTDMARMGVDIFFRPSVRKQLAREIAAQFEAFAASGLALDHVNAHKHFHLHPTIAASIVEIGKRFGLRAARVPVEPPAVLRMAEPGTPVGPAFVTAPWAWALRARFRRAGLLVPDRVFGLAWSGAMTPARLRRLIACLPEGLSEIYLHPALDGRFAGAAPAYRYREEFEALIDPEVASAARGEARLGGFSDFV